MSCLIQTGHIKDLLTTKGNDNAKAQFINLSTNVRDLERQLDASQALLAEAEYQIEKQTIETRAATQLASDYIKQLAEAMAEIEKLTIYRDFAQSESSDAAITRAEAWNAGRKLTAYEILDIVARSVGKQSQLYKQICTDYKLEG